jgi:hypothetical protein
MEAFVVVDNMDDDYSVKLTGAPYNDVYRYVARPLIITGAVSPHCFYHHVRIFNSCVEAFVVVYRHLYCSYHYIRIFDS